MTNANGSLRLGDCRCDGLRPPGCVHGFLMFPYSSCRRSGDPYHCGRQAVDQYRAHGAWNMRMSEWGKPAVHRAHKVMDMPLLRDRGEREYILMLDGILCILDERWTMLLAMLKFWFLNAPYKTRAFFFLVEDVTWGGPV